MVGVGLLALGCSYRGGLSAAFTQQLLLRAMCLGEKLLGFARVLPSQDTSILHPSLLIPSTSINRAEMKGVASCRCPGAGPALENLLNHYEQQGVLSQIQQKCLEVV